MRNNCTLYLVDKHNAVTKFMSTDSDSNNQPKAAGQSDSGRPPIQWPTRSVDRQTEDSKRAAELARQHVERTYQREGEPNQIEPVPEKRVPKIIQPLQQEALGQKAQEPQQDQRTMHSQTYDWEKYHTAWQQYYHQYFYRYYAGWWQQQREQLEADVRRQTPAQPEEQLNDQQRATKELHQKVQSSVQKQSKKIRASSHFRPLIAALTVGASFLLLNYNQVIVGAAKQYVAPGSVVTTPVIVEPNTKNTVSADPKIIIPKIGVDVPVVYDEPKVDEASYQKALERGVVRLGNTANPGTKGNVVIGGHSSNNVFNPGKYKYVFVNLKRLDVGDIFYLNYNGKRYTYKVTVAKKIITPKETSVLAQTTTPTVTLFTCDPPGTNVNRLIVQGVQIDPDPSDANSNTNQSTSVNSANPLPSVAPSLWNRLFR